ncbi:MAG: helix-turn-helix transcriptional regulator [Chloroflexi bacterium]|nr:helix-turn-helix transcriptional regulator [Chloroflexota bacterium]
MAKTKEYRHFCPVARSLEVIGEKWSLLIVRDLLRGPQRFTDLMKYLGGISPKWLTLRLRHLEEAGIVERESEAGRREVLYRLTAKGRGLEPAVAALAVWGIDYALRPPLAGEPIYPEQTLSAVTFYLNHAGVRLKRPAAWEFRFGDERHTVRFDGERWTLGGPATKPDVVVTTTPEEWVAFLVMPQAGRKRRVASLPVSGSAGNVEAFRRIVVGARA